MDYAGDLFDLCLLAFAAYVGRAWVRWYRSEERWATPKWRSVVTVVGCAASTISLLLILALTFHALLTGGLPYYDPTLMQAMASGFMTALLGVFGALVGKGKLEIPTIICSVVCLLIWFAEAIAQ